MRILWVYPNSFLTTSIPLGIAYMSAILKAHGHEVDLFDTTFYNTGENQNAKKEGMGQAGENDYGFFNDVVREYGRLIPDYFYKLDRFKPDLVAFSIVEESWHLAKALNSATVSNNLSSIPIVVGGVFPTFAYSKVRHAFPSIDICSGEGEHWLLDYMDIITPENRTFLRIDNRLIDINELPFPDYDLFHPKMLYRPMQGQIRKTLMVETQRGCPYNCTFCNSEAQKDMYGKGFYRRKRIDRIDAELEYLTEKYNPEFIYFVGDSFLSLPEMEWRSFCKMYMKYKLPFWMNTRPETITPSRVSDLEEINCIRCNLGIEHGDEEFRKTIVNKRSTNVQIVEACKCFKDSKIQLVVNNILGYPGETRELLEQTILLNKRIAPYINSSSAFIFTPYHGTKLRDKAIADGYMESDVICSNLWDGPVISNPYIPDEELNHLQRNWNEIIMATD